MRAAPVRYGLGRYRRSCGSRLINTEAMATFLADHSHDTRKALRELFKDPLFRPKYNVSLDEERDLAYKRLKKVCELGVVSVRDFLTEPRNIFAAHEMCGQCDGNLSTKLTVQFNLFGGTVMKLGTQKHHDQLCDNIDKLQSVGCFGLTELGYGNNAVEMETTATYDKDTDEFIIHTPSPLAQKYWITNGAVHAHYCVVFARILIPEGDGHRDEGLHGFLVPIRKESDLSVKPNVRVWDMGYKIGLNGIDNAALWFDKVRVPRDALLDRTSQVAAGGEFTSSVKDDSARKRKRFIKLADQLLSGRVCIAAMCIGSTQMVLGSAIRYSTTRKAVGPTGFSDTPIMDYQLQRNTLMPLVATTYALKIALNHVQARYSALSTKADATPEEENELIRICCIIKPLVTWHAEHTATTCRERCGGQGFLAANRFGEAIVGAHAGITAEGDNRVMQLKVATELLKQKVDKKAVMAHAGKQKLPLPAAWNNGISGTVTDLAWQRKVFQARFQWSLCELAWQFHCAKQAKEPLFETAMQKQSDLIQRVGTAYGEDIVATSCGDAIAKAPAELRADLEKLICLWGLYRMQEDSGFLQQEGFISAAQARAISDAQRDLCGELGGKARELVEAFGIPEYMHHEPISHDWKQYNAADNPFGELDDQTFRKNIADTLKGATTTKDTPKSATTAQDMPQQTHIEIEFEKPLAQAAAA